jgi:hypothetical protein
VIDDELRLEMSHAAEEFPVRGWPGDMQRRVIRRRRRTAGLTLAAGAMAAAAVAVLVPLVTSSNPGPGSTMLGGSTASASYVGSNWRLTNVTKGANNTTIPASLGADMELRPDGHILVNDSVNGLYGQFTKNAHGFEVHNVISSTVGYYGKDPHRLDVIDALGTLAYGDGYTGQWSGPARDTVVSVGRTRLIIQAGAFRLTFVRAGAATITPLRPGQSGYPG